MTTITRSHEAVEAINTWFAKLSSTERTIFVAVADALVNGRQYHCVSRVHRSITMAQAAFLDSASGEVIVANVYDHIAPLILGNADVSMAEVLSRLV